MKIVDLRPGMQVLHPEYGLGEVKMLTEKSAEVLFNEGRKTLTAEQVAELKPAEPSAKLDGLDKPLRDLIAEVVAATVGKLNLKVDADEFTPQLAPRWVGGKVVLHPHDASLAPKDSRWSKPRFVSGTTQDSPPRSFTVQGSSCWDFRCSLLCWPLSPWQKKAS